MHGVYGLHTCRARAARSGASLHDTVEKLQTWLESSVFLGFLPSFSKGWKTQRVQRNGKGEKIGYLKIRGRCTRLASPWPKRNNLALSEKVRWIVVALVMPNPKVLRRLFVSGSLMLCCKHPGLNEVTSTRYIHLLTSYHCVETLNLFHLSTTPL